MTLDAVQGVVDAAFRHLRSRCEVDGKLDSELLDAHQLASYELAFCAAELGAARAAVRHAAAVAGDSLVAALARLYCAEAIQGTRARLEARAEDYGLARAQIGAAFDADAVQAQRREALAADSIARIGQELVARGALPAGHLDEDKEIIRRTFARFAAENVAPLAQEIHRRDLDIPDAILKPAAELGLFGVSIPQRYGGLQPDDHDDVLSMIVATEELSHASLGAAGSLVTRPEIVARALLAGGTEEQRAYWLPRLAAGETLCAVSITEPDYGSDVASMKLRASRVPGGWQLDGAKTWCTFGGRAELVLVLARTNPEPALGHRGLSLFLVEKPAFSGHAFEHVQPQGGRLVGKAIATIGYRGMHSYDLFFERLFVPDTALVGGAQGEGRGFYFTMSGFSGGRIQTAARAVGVMQAAYEAGVRYASGRKVFGAAVADYQLSQVKIARMAAWLQAARQFTYAVARLMEQGKGQMEASLVKLFACRAAEWLSRESMQLHGGMGYAEESDVSRLFVDARVLSIFEGAEETLALKVIARDLIARA
ncbi:MAG TPA: acyl-CoA dehydrogenase family protein [Steroidobacteraceae bacterium]|nr:acyl-CoA dehydrogenase family protein [Steroidobacteraceae bacterium]